MNAENDADQMAAGLRPEIVASFRSLKDASRLLRQLPSSTKENFLNSLARTLEKRSGEILQANQIDLQALPADTASAFRDRLTLNPQRVIEITQSLQTVAGLPDPVGELVDKKTLENGLQLRRVRAPFGVILMIFESRPNVILEAFALAFKSGNAIALRGGSESRATAAKVYAIMRQVLTDHGLPPASFLGFEDYDRDLVAGLLRRKDLIDVVVPRGGDRLIDFVQKQALMPIIKNDRGLCHAYVDLSVDLAMAVNVVANAKTSRPGVCNSLETVLVNELVARDFLLALYQKTEDVKLRWKCDSVSLQILRGKARVEPADEVDWDTEHLDQILNCRVVQNLASALDHIDRHGSKHSEVILTSDESVARKFQAEVDAAAVYWNASTRFTDGYQFGLGGELGISTQKIHVRGPVGLRELTTPRWIIDGTGQIRP